jgi:CRISPR/Cas system-associated exonuclease Cas4 (RecB family)
MAPKPIPGTPNYLALLNAHPRDENISFEEGPHIYTVCGERGTYKSVTTWNHSHFSHFDADKIIDNMLASGKMSDPKHKYYGMTKKEIKDLWAKNGAAASGSGTKMHQDIEYYYNGMTPDNDSIEYTYFLNFAKDHANLRPYRTEWMVYYEELMISGSIDMVFRRKSDGKFVIYDWKRSKEIKSDNQYKKGLAPLNHLPDTNYWHYTMQLNVYKWILETYYGLDVADLYLVILHPNQSSYQRMRLNIMTDEVEDMIECRRRAVEGGCKQSVILPIDKNDEVEDTFAFQF